MFLRDCVLKGYWSSVCGRVRWERGLYFPFFSCVMRLYVSKVMNYSLCSEVSNVLAGFCNASSRIFFRLDLGTVASCNRRRHLPMLFRESCAGAYPPFLFSRHYEQPLNRQEPYVKLRLVHKEISFFMRPCLLIYLSTCTSRERVAHIFPKYRIKSHDLSTFSFFFNFCKIVVRGTLEATLI